MNSANSEQTQAITHESGEKNLIVIAGPGTGKTRVIIKRLNHLVTEKNVDIETILVTSYTNRAINEIANRAQEDSHLAFGLQYAGTLHSIAIKILKKFKTKLESISNSMFYTVKVTDIFSDKKFKSIIDDITGIIGGAPNNKAYQQIENYISDTKLYGYLEWLRCNRGVKGWKLYKNEKKQHQFLHQQYRYSGKSPLRQDQLQQIFDAHNEYSLAEGEMFFGDVLIWFHQLLIHEETGVRAWARKYFSHILVDEFQDMNKLQLEILKELSGNNKNMCCVGDPNQSIYSFQGAHPGIFDDFIDGNHDQICTISLQHNYRSHTNIIDFSNKSILSNCPSINIVGDDKKTKQDIYFFEDQTADDGAKRLINMIKNLRKLKDQGDEKGSLLKDIAILYSNRNVNIKVMDLLSKEKINFLDYQLINEFDQWKIQSLICFLNLSFSKDSFCIKCLLIIHQNEKKIDPDIVVAIERESKKHGNCWYKALMNISIPEHYEESKKNINKLQQFIKEVEDIGAEYHDLLIYEWDNQKSNNPKSEYLSVKSNMKTETGKLNQEIIKMINKYWFGNTKHVQLSSLFTDMWKNFSVFFDRTNNTKSFYNHALDYVKYYFDSQENDCINISTIHSAKGCEFDHVFFIGITDGEIPYIGAKKEDKIRKDIVHSSLEEERRKFYVGITRPKKHLYLFHSKLAYKFGKHIKSQVSCFAEEMINMKQPGVIDYFKHNHVFEEKNFYEPMYEDMNLQYKKPTIIEKTKKLSFFRSLFKKIKF